jgi:hypothetical protein
MGDFGSSDLRQRNRAYTPFPLSFVTACHLNLVHRQNLDAILPRQTGRGGGQHHLFE